MFFKTNKCIFIGVRTKAFTMQSKNKIGAWAHMRPPLFIYRKTVALRHIAVASYRQCTDTLR